MTLRSAAPILRYREHISVRPAVRVLYQSIMFANGTGGVGKTSICANVAGLASQSGWRTLVIDLDPHGSLGSDLGYKQRGLSDEGESLFGAVISGAPIRPLRNVRRNLDAVPAGSATKELLAMLTDRRKIDATRVLDILRVIEPLEEHYDLLLIDSPAVGGYAVEAALAATHWLVAPVKFGDASRGGLEMMTRQMEAVRTTANPDLQLLGVAIFDYASPRAVVRSEERRRMIDELGSGTPVFKSMIRRADRVAYDMRREGLLAHEYAQRSESGKNRAPIAQRIKRSQRNTSGDRHAVAAAGLAADYKKLATEILLSLGEVAHSVRS